MPAPSIEREIARTRAAQRAAAEPGASAWVSANAGTGKTHVLTMRVLRLLLAGTSPERLLSLTFTKAAAAEMATRVFDVLAKWVTLPEDGLKEALTELLGREPLAPELFRARTLFALAIETPGGLKVQTIHAFCERLLQRFPIEAGVPPGFEVLEEETARALEREAIAGMLREAAGAPASLLGRALKTAVAYAADESLDRVLGEAIAERRWLGEANRIDGDDGDDPLGACEALYRQALDVPADAQRERHGSAHDEPGIEGADDAAHVDHRLGLDALDQLA